MRHVTSLQIKQNAVFIMELTICEAGRSGRNETKLTIPSAIFVFLLAKIMCQRLFHSGRMIRKKEKRYEKDQIFGENTIFKILANTSRRRIIFMSKLASWRQFNALRSLDLDRNCCSALRSKYKLSIAEQGKRCATRARMSKSTGGRWLLATQRTAKTFHRELKWSVPLASTKKLKEKLWLSTTEPRSS